MTTLQEINSLTWFDLINKLKPILKKINFFSQDKADAINSANNPSKTNYFATISDIPGGATNTAVMEAIALKQDILVSGTNIKTINGTSILGSGDIAVSGGGGNGNGATNLTATQSSIAVTINSDTGTDATIPLANGTNAGVSSNDYTPTEKSKLAGIANSATANSADAVLLNRANHTGTQLATTISDFNTAVDGRITNKVDKVANKSLVLDTEITKIATAVQPNVNTVFTSVNSNAIVTLTYTANTLNWTGLESNLLKIVLTKDSILANPSTPITNTIYQFIVEQNSVGLWTLTYGNKFKFPNGTVPVIDLNANSKGLLTCLYDGTHFLVVSAQNFL